MNGVLICNCFKYFILFDSLINELCFACREKKGLSQMLPLQVYLSSLGSFMKSCNAMQYFVVYSALFLNMFMSNIYYNYSYH